jgi:hypothetical protein
MPKFFSRVICDGVAVRDDGEAEEFPDLAATKRNAIKGAREILSSAVLVGRGGTLDVHIEVQDEAGQSLFIVRCGRVVDADSQGTI